MSTLNTVYDMLDYIKTTQGLITLWRPDNSKPQWFTANSKDPRSLTANNKFANFLVPWPLLWRNDDGQGTFFFNRQWITQTKSIGIEGKADVDNANMTNEKIKPTGNPSQTYPIPREMTQTSEQFASLQNDPNIWLPFVVIPADGSAGSYDRRVYFTPLSDTRLV